MKKYSQWIGVFSMFSEPKFGVLVEGVVVAVGNSVVLMEEFVGF